MFRLIGPGRCISTGGHTARSAVPILLATATAQRGCSNGATTTTTTAEKAAASSSATISSSVASFSQKIFGGGPPSTSSSSPSSTVTTSTLSTSSTDAAAASTTSESVQNYEPKRLKRFKYMNRIWYNGFSRNKTVDNFIVDATQQMLSVCTTYRSIDHPDITVTLVPLTHFAHPQFYYQVDLLLCQHDSVLMEGRTPFQQAPFSTLVPPRSLPEFVRPPEIDGSSGGWEPKDMAAYWQPFSWGVKESPNYTVIHAADKYDYERLPWFASLRFNLPLIGSFAREKHCLDMIPPLVDNGYRSFAIPWGAAHMPIIHEMLVHNGFEEASATSLPIFDATDGDISRSHISMWTRKAKGRVLRTDLFYSFLGLGVGVLGLYMGVCVDVTNKDFIDVVTSKTGSEGERTVSNMQRS